MTVDPNSKILSPHIDPTEHKMEASGNTLLFLMLRNELPKYTGKAVESSKAMHERLRLMYIDGFSDSLDHWGEFAKSKKQFMASAQQLIEELNKWEKKFLEWQTSVHGEQAVKNKLAEALKG
jgi:hypothetical protein